MHREWAFAIVADALFFADGEVSARLTSRSQTVMLGRMIKVILCHVSSWAFTGFGFIGSLGIPDTTFVLLKR
jgi:hypothetical protein